MKKVVNLTVVMLVLILTSCSYIEETFVFSSRTSPNGQLIVENIKVGGAGEGAIGQLAIRSTHGGKSQLLFLGQPEADLFLRWVDDKHIVAWRTKSSDDANNKKLAFVNEFARVQIEELTYTEDQRQSFSTLEMERQFFEIPSNKLHAVFNQNEDRNGKHCRLLVEVPSTPNYEFASVDIEFRLWKLNAKEIHADVNTHFKLDNPSKVSSKYMLTSATISDISSYNRLPEGSEGTMIRGQFLERYSVDLVDKLKSNSFQLEYSRNFFKQVLKYEIPTVGIKYEIDQLLICLGDAKFVYQQ